MLNHITIMGRLTRDPELRRTNAGTPVASFSLACSRDFARNKADFFDCVAWQSTAEFVKKYFHKGQQVVVQGRLQTRTWEDDAGNRRKAVEIVVDSIYFADSKTESIKGDYASPELDDPYADLRDDEDDMPF